VIQQKLPVEAFEELMSPMVEADCPGLRRDPATGKLIPTNQDKPQSSVNEYKYTVGKASSLDRLFDFRSQDPTLPAPEVATEADGAYEVETVVGRRVTDSGKVEYEIKWAGWEAAHNSWEPALGICGSLTRAYDREHPFTAAENARRPNKKRRLAQAPLRPARGAGCARARLSTAAQRRGGVPEHISMVCSPVHVELVEPKDRKSMPRVEITFHVMTMDSAGHIIWPKEYSAARKAEMRRQARAMLEEMIRDPANPCDATMAPALTGMGTSSVFQGAAQRQYVTVQSA